MLRRCLHRLHLPYKDLTDVNFVAYRRNVVGVEVIEDPNDPIAEDDEPFNPYMVTETYDPELDNFQELTYSYIRRNNNGEERVIQVDGTHVNNQGRPVGPQGIVDRLEDDFTANAQFRVFRQVPEPRTANDANDYSVPDLLSEPLWVRVYTTDTISNPDFIGNGVLLSSTYPTWAMTRHATGSFRPRDFRFQTPFPLLHYSGQWPDSMDHGRFDGIDHSDALPHKMLDL